MVNLKQQIGTGLVIGTVCGIGLLVSLTVIKWAIENTADEEYLASLIATQVKAASMIEAVAAEHVDAEVLRRKALAMMAEARALVAAGAKVKTVVKWRTETVAVESPCRLGEQLNAEAEWSSVEFEGDGSMRWLKAGPLKLHLWGTDEHANMAWERRMELPVPPKQISFEVAEVTPDQVVIATPLARKLHWGSGLVCGPTVGATIQAWPTVSAGISAGVGCTWGKGLVK